MIVINYMGRAGNQAFQWMFARMLSKKTGLAIITPPPTDFLHAKHCYEGECCDHDGQEIVIKDISDCPVSNLLNVDYSAHIIRLYGYFQNPEYYNDHRDEIKTWFDLPEAQTNFDDIVVNIRLQDYWGMKSVIHHDWYFKILERETFKKMWVVVEPHPTNKRYIDRFRVKYGRRLQFFEGTPEQQFNFMRSFDRIVCCNSTFSWLAAFLGNARKIYLNRPWLNTRYPPPLYNMKGATVVDCKFARDTQLENIDLKEYWKK